MIGVKSTLVGGLLLVYEEQKSRVGWGGGGVQDILVSICGVHEKKAVAWEGIRYFKLVSHQNPPTINNNRPLRGFNLVKDISGGELYALIGGYVCRHKIQRDMSPQASSF